MSSLTSLEKIKLELYLNMGSGYVLDFVDKSFRNFFLDTVQIDIELDKYKVIGTSKANRMRSFWNQENDLIVGQLLNHILDYRDEKTKLMGEIFPHTDASLDEDCRSIAKRLLYENSIDLDAITETKKDISWKKINDEIKDCIQRNNPEAGIDRLHTYMMYFFRDLNKTHNIPYNHDTPLNSLAGAYISYLRVNKLVDSEMSLKILKYCVKILEDFNDVRNNKSLTHPNPIINHDEAFFIFSYISGLIRFIKTIETTLTR